MPASWNENYRAMIEAAIHPSNTSLNHVFVRSTTRITETNLIFLWWCWQWIRNRHRFASVTDVKVLADCTYPMSLQSQVVEVNKEDMKDVKTNERRYTKKEESEKKRKKEGEKGRQILTRTTHQK